MFLARGRSWTALKSCRRDTGLSGETARSAPNPTGRCRLFLPNSVRLTPPRRSWIGSCRKLCASISLSDVPLGVWLSGGIDSSTILHYAAQASSSRLKTLSISFEAAASTNPATSSRSPPSTELIIRNSTSTRTRIFPARSKSSRTTPMNPRRTPVRCPSGFYPR